MVSPDLTEATTMITNAVELRPALRVTSAEQMSKPERRRKAFWLPAARPTDQLSHDVRLFLARHSYSQYVITQYRDFLKCDMSPTADLATIGIVARGLQRYGPPFSAYVRHVGVAGVHEGLEDEFQRVYLGEFPDDEAAVSEVVNLLEDSEALHITNSHDEGTTYAFLNCDRFSTGSRLGHLGRRSAYLIQISVTLRGDLRIERDGPRGDRGARGDGGRKG